MTRQHEHAGKQVSPARYPHEDLNNWGKWGKEDERGAANYITPAAIAAAAKLIQDGRTFSLAIPLDHTGPVWPGRICPHHTMAASGSDYDAGMPSGFLGAMSFADDYMYMPLQGSTQWDALSHGWYDAQLYNGFPQSAIRGAPYAGGATKLGIQNVKDTMVGRGVLVDVLGYKGGALPKGYGITRADIELTLEKQGAEVRPGDMVIIRTGVVPDWYRAKSPADRMTYFSAGQAGIVKDVLPWMKEKQIAGMAADNLSLEQNPNEMDPNTVSPLHGNILRDLGVYIGEIWWLEDLAADCARDGRYEFFLAAQPLNITGAVGTPINPIAIK